MDRFYVIGNPVNHSLSPAIHAAFARQFGIEQTYETRRFERFAEDMGALRREMNPAGVNITVRLSRMRSTIAKSSRIGRSSRVPSTP